MASKSLNQNAEPFEPRNASGPRHGQQLIPYNGQAVIGHPTHSLVHYYPQPSFYPCPPMHYFLSSVPYPTKFVADVKPDCFDETARNVVSAGYRKRSGGARVSNNRRFGKQTVVKVNRSESPEKKEPGDVLPFPVDFEALKLSGKTTVMVKNIPNHFRRNDLIRILNQHCRFVNEKASIEGTAKTEYDFLYLPMDFNKFWHQRKTANLGYAFVNFTKCIGAWRFHDAFNNLNWKSATNNKTCQVTLAKTQGRVALEHSFRTKLFYCHTDEYLPLVFKPACNGFGSRFLARTVGRRVPHTPRHGMRKST